MPDPGRQDSQALTGCSTGEKPFDETSDTPCTTDEMVEEQNADHLEHFNDPALLGVISEKRVIENHIQQRAGQKHPPKLLPN